MRAHRARRRLQRLACSEDPAVYGKPPEAEIVREDVDARDLERFAAAAVAIQSTDSPRSVVAANVAELLRLFGARGFFGANLHDQPLVTPPPLLRIERVGMAIDTILSRAGTRPMVVDLSHALGCSDRQARYLVREYADAYALQGAREWRTLVSVWTTYLAALCSMTARDATATEQGRLAPRLRLAERVLSRARQRGAPVPWRSAPACRPARMTRCVHLCARSVPRPIEAMRSG